MENNTKEIRRFAIGAFLLLTIAFFAVFRSPVVFIYAIAFALLLLLIACFSVRRHLIRMVEQHENAKSSFNYFFLLLRPFNIYNYQRTTYKKEWGHFTEPESLIITASDNVVFKLEKATRGKATLVAVGDSFGRSDIPYDHRMLLLDCQEAQWQQKVQILARFSRAIILLPNTSEGLLEEMRLIQANDLWKKTIMIMPPLYKSHNVVRIVGGSYLSEGQEREDWERVRHELTKHHYNIPAPMESGMVCTVNTDFSARDIVYPKSWDTFSLADSIDAVMPNLEGECLPLKDAYRILEPLIPRINFGLREIVSRTPDRACYFIHQLFSPTYI